MRAWLLGLVTGALTTLAVLLLMAPNCPTEDSCKPDYLKVGTFGLWTGKEVTP